jgi:hypothetical protein
MDPKAQAEIDRKLESLADRARRELDYHHLSDSKSGHLAPSPESIEGTLREMETIRVMSDQAVAGQRVATLWDEVAAWSNATFGDESERGPVGPVKHLAIECLESIGMDTEQIQEFRSWMAGIQVFDREFDHAELADILILLMDAGRRSGVNWPWIVARAIEKMDVNRSRTYPKPAPGDDTISEHDRSAE